MKREKSNIETDWQLFKRNIAKWRENYLGIKNKEIISKDDLVEFRDELKERLYIMLNIEEN